MKNSVRTAIAVALVAAFSFAGPSAYAGRTWAEAPSTSTTCVESPAVEAKAAVTERVRYHWTGGKTDVAPAADAEGWEDDSSNARGPKHDPALHEDSTPYQAGKGKNASWFKYETVEIEPAVEGKEAVTCPEVTTTPSPTPVTTPTEEDTDKPGKGIGKGVSKDKDDKKIGKGVSTAPVADGEVVGELPKTGHVGNITLILLALGGLAAGIWLYRKSL